MSASPADSAEAIDIVVPVESRARRPSKLALWLAWSVNAARANRTQLRRFLRESPAWLASAGFHAALLIVLGLWMLPELREAARSLVATTIAEPTDPIQELPTTSAVETPALENEVGDPTDAVSVANLLDSVEAAPVDDAPAPALSLDLADLGVEMAPTSDLTSELGIVGGRGLEGRGEAARKILVAQRGGSVASENAVSMALSWIIEHQQPDGGWSFEHRSCPSCQGQCADPGVLKGRIGATALALLPLLGAGQTHLRGKYSTQIEAGLNFLVSQMRLTPEGGNLMDDGRLYSHGLATIALCEAYALSKDQALLGPAQQAVNFTIHAQDKVGGGWRYEPGQPGDTSALGWQLMALKSAYMAYLLVPPEITEMASHFLDSVAVDGGATYGYTERKPQDGTTAVGLLCRMYLGWQRDNEALRRGLGRLATVGPSRGNFYYNYYATQVMAHYEGEEWEKWNRAMRDYLVQSQAKEGHEAGSWFAGDDHGSKPGGRLYMTALACMTLEVYYRHLPLYQQDAARTEFEPQGRRGKPAQK